MKVQTVEAQLSDSDSSTSNKSDKFTPHKEKSTQKKYPEVILQREEFACLLSFIANKEINLHVMLK
jgi:hypothetical protein